MTTADQSAPGVAALAAAAAKWKPQDHPRGNDGKFIEKGALSNFLSAETPTAGQIIDAATQMTEEKWSKLTPAQQSHLTEQVNTLPKASAVSQKLKNKIHGLGKEVAPSETPDGPKPKIAAVHKGAAPGTPAKVTTSMVWAKHDDGDEVLELPNGDRVRWNDKTKKYEIVDASTGEVTESLSKKNFWEKYKGLSGKVPGGEKPADETPEPEASKPPTDYEYSLNLWNKGLITTEEFKAETGENPPGTTPEPKPKFTPDEQQELEEWEKELLELGVDPTPAPINSAPGGAPLSYNSEDVIDNWSGALSGAHAVGDVVALHSNGMQRITYGGMAFGAPSYNVEDWNAAAGGWEPHVGWTGLPDFWFDTYAQSQLPGVWVAPLPNGQPYPTKDVTPKPKLTDDAQQLVKPDGTVDWNEIDYRMQQGQITNGVVLAVVDSPNGYSYRIVAEDVNNGMVRIESRITGDNDTWETYTNDLSPWQASEYLLSVTPSEWQINPDLTLAPPFTPSPLNASHASTIWSQVSNLPDGTVVAISGSGEARIVVKNGKLQVQVKSLVGDNNWKYSKAIGSEDALSKTLGKSSMYWTSTPNTPTKNEATSTSVAPLVPDTTPSAQDVTPSVPDVAPSASSPTGKLLTGADASNLFVAAESLSEGDVLATGTFQGIGGTTSIRIVVGMNGSLHLQNQQDNGKWASYNTVFSSPGLAAQLDSASYTWHATDAIDVVLTPGSAITPGKKLAGDDAPMMWNSARVLPPNTVVATGNFGAQAVQIITMPDGSLDAQVHAEGKWFQFTKPMTTLVQLEEQLNNGSFNWTATDALAAPSTPSTPSVPVPIGAPSVPLAPVTAPTAVIKPNQALTAADTDNIWSSVLNMAPGGVVATGSLFGTQKRIIIGVDGKLIVQSKLNDKWLTTEKIDNQDNLSKYLSASAFNWKASSELASAPLVAMPSTSIGGGDASHISPQTKKNFKAILKQHNVGYWSKPDKIWEAVQAIQKQHPQYTHLQILKALDSTLNTSDPSPFETKMVKWFKTPKGKLALANAGMMPSMMTPGSVTSPGVPDIGTGDISGVPPTKKAHIYKQFKAFSGTSLDSPTDSIWAGIDEMANTHGLTKLQILRIIDEEGAKKFGVANANLFEKKVTDWLKTPNGAAIASGHKPTSKELANFTPLFAPGINPANDIPSFDESSQLTYNVVPVLQAQSIHNAANAAYVAGGGKSALTSVFRTYTGGAYIPINSYLYGELGSVSASHAALIKRMQWNMRPSTKPMLLHRGVDFNGIGNAKNYSDLQKMVGQTWMGAGFTSTSVGGTAAFLHKPVIVEIEAPPGTPMHWIDPVNEYPEDEMLLAAGLSYRIVSVSKNANGKSVVRIRVVPEEPTI